jgi:hypothetical protein
MARAVALNVGANTNEPGFRGPLYPDLSFEFLPIPETEPAESVPTYGDLDPELRFDIPESAHDTPVHLDPEFAGYPCCSAYTYGDPYGVKAQPVLELDAGDYLYFYATLDVCGAGHPESVPPEWGAFVVGEFRLARDPVPGEAYPKLAPDERAAFDSNAHVRRETMDAAVLALGDGTSKLYERAVPLSGAEGTEANELVTELSNDSGKGPWWRRPLRFAGRDATRFRAALADPERVR